MESPTRLMLTIELECEPSEAWLSSRWARTVDAANPEWINSSCSLLAPDGIKGLRANLFTSFELEAIRLGLLCDGRGVETPLEISSLRVLQHEYTEAKLSPLRTLHETCCMHCCVKTWSVRLMEQCHIDSDPDEWPVTEGKVISEGAMRNRPVCLLLSSRSRSGSPFYPKKPPSGRDIQASCNKRGA